MSGPIIRSGASSEFSKNWEKIFGGSKKAASKPAAKKAAPSKKKAAKKKRAR